MLNNMVLNTVRSSLPIVIVHWIAFAVYLWIFGYAGLYKIFKVPGMMEGMSSMGFNTRWTMVIGVAETLGVTGLIIGIFVPAVKNFSVLFLIPFAIGAFTVHMSYHHGFADYCNSLIVCILSVFLLATDRHFTILLK